MPCPQQANATAQGRCSAAPLPACGSTRPPRPTPPSAPAPAQKQGGGGGPAPTARSAAAGCTAGPLRAGWAGVPGQDWSDWRQARDNGPHNDTACSKPDAPVNFRPLSQPAAHTPAPRAPSPASTSMLKCCASQAARFCSSSVSSAATSVFVPFSAESCNESSQKRGQLNQHHIRSAALPTRLGCRSPLNPAMKAAKKSPT